MINESTPRLTNDTPLPRLNPLILNEIAHNSSLTALSLRNTTIEHVEAAQIAKMILAHPTLTTIDLSNHTFANHLNGSAILELVESTTLTTINLSTTGLAHFRDPRAREHHLAGRHKFTLRESFTFGCRLSHLSLRGVEISAVSHRCFLNALRLNRSIISIDLHGCFKDHDSENFVEYLSAAIAQNSTLQSLILSENFIEDQPFKKLPYRGYCLNELSILRALKVNGCLRSIVLDGTVWAKEYYGIIPELLMTNHVLTNIHPRFSDDLDDHLYLNLLNEPNRTTTLFQLLHAAITNSHAYFNPDHLAGTS